MLLTIDNLISLFVGCGLFYLGYQANKIAKSNLELAITKDERELFYKSYTKLVEACNLFRKTANHFNKETNKNQNTIFFQILDIFYKTSEHARLFLPKEIVKYTRDIEKQAWKYNNLRLQEPYGLSKEEEQEKRELMREISLKEHHQIFSPYLKIRAKKQKH